MFTSKVETGEEEDKGKGTEKVRHEVRDGKWNWERETRLGTRSGNTARQRQAKTREKRVGPVHIDECIPARAIILVEARENLHGPPE